MRIAIVEMMQIDPSRDAGARAIIDLQSSLARLGYKSQMFYEGKDLRKQIHRYQANVIVVSRPQVMARCRDFKELFGVPVIFWAQDFHSRRQSLGEKLGGGSANASFLMSLVEKSAITGADIAVFPTIEEANAALRKLSLTNVEHHPYFLFSEAELTHVSERKNNLVFIGSSGHQPNVDGLNWFLTSCWPAVQGQFSDTRLFIIGDWAESDLTKDPSQGVEFLGKLSEANVNIIMRSNLIGISPLRFGAGIKRKTLQYLHAGLVTVSTDFGLEGLPRDLDDKAWYRANGPEEFATTICKILGDDMANESMSNSGRENILKLFSKDRFDSRLSEILARLGT